jgi:hypothetical protein
MSENNIQSIIDHVVRVFDEYRVISSIRLRWEGHDNINEHKGTVVNPHGRRKHSWRPESKVSSILEFVTGWR